jgi:hypothetical protein
MTTIPPPSPIAPSVPTAAAGPATAVLTQLPPSLQSAGPGTIVTGTVVSVDNHGQIVLQTGAGLVSVQSGASVSVGQQVSLQIQATGSGQAQAIVLAAEAVAAAELTAPGSAAAEAPTPAATIAPSIATGSVVIATVIGPSPAVPSPAAVSASAGTSAAPRAAPASGASASPSPATSALAQSASAAPPAGRTASPTPTPAAAAAASPGTTAPAGSAPAPIASRLPAAPPIGSSEPIANATPSTTSPVPVAPAATAVSQASTATLPAGAAEPNIAAGPAVPGATASAPSTPGPQQDTALPTSGLLAAQAEASSQPLSAAIAKYTASSLPPAGGNTAAGVGGGPAGDAAALPTPPAGTQVPLRFVGPLPNLAAATAGASSGQLVATVVAVTPAGQVVLDTAIGRLALNAPPAADNAIGSQIAFEIAAPAVRPSAAGPSDALPVATSRGLAALTTEWPSLKSVLTALAEVDPRVAQHVMETALPRPDNPRFLSQILSLINAPADDVKMLLGQAAADALQQAGRGDVMSGLNADLRQMARLNASPSDWRIFYVPLFDSTEARQLRIFTRRRRSGSDQRRDNGGRFVIEVEFEELGPLQLDGLVQKPRLDLILRTHAELPSILRTGIADVFDQTCESAGLQGKIFFQAIPAFPVSPLDEMTASSASGVSV